MTVTPPDHARASVWLTSADCHLDDFIDVVSTATDPDDHPLATSVEHGIPVYDGDAMRALLDGPISRREVQAELIRCFAMGAGIAVFRGACADLAVVDRVTDAFRAMITDQRASGAGGGDHFAPPGANDRVWNAAEKLALRDPDAFVDYYANDVIAAVCEAWLGPGYQLTSQVNVVNPGGRAQAPHRDYHLGFMNDEQAARYPAHVHRLSPTLTLQGAIAHCDMPVESGPTMYLPHSQKYELGYLAWARPEFAAYFADHHVQLPLRTGDMVFFNPALFHAAGTNHTTNIHRMANLLQVSSAFGRAMEAVDRAAIAQAVLPSLRALIDRGAPAQAIRNAVAASAEGYPFPADLDRDQPVDGLAPASQADLLLRALGCPPRT